MNTCQEPCLFQSSILSWDSDNSTNAKSQAMGCMLDDPYYNKTIKTRFSGGLKWVCCSFITVTGAAENFGFRLVSCQLLGITACTYECYRYIKICRSIILPSMLMKSNNIHLYRIIQYTIWETWEENKDQRKTIEEGYHTQLIQVLGLVGEITRPKQEQPAAKLGEVPSQTNVGRIRTTQASSLESVHWNKSRKFDSEFKLKGI